MSTESRGNTKQTTLGNAQSTKNGQKFGVPSR